MPSKAAAIIGRVPGNILMAKFQILTAKKARALVRVATCLRYKHSAKLHTAAIYPGHRPADDWLTWLSTSKSWAGQMTHDAANLRVPRVRAVQQRRKRPSYCLNILSLFPLLCRSLEYKYITPWPPPAHRNKYYYIDKCHYFILILMGDERCCSVVLVPPCCTGTVYMLYVVCCMILYGLALAFLASPVNKYPRTTYE